MNANTNVNMYKNAEVCKNKCVCENPTTCGIKAGTCMCAGIKSTHGYAWYGRACTAPCTCNVVCMCGKIHAQESEENSNNKSNKIIKWGTYGWGRNVCQKACRKTVDRATCMCVCMCTTHTDKRNSRVCVAEGAARNGGGVLQPTSSREFARSSLRIKLGDSGGDNVSKGDSNDSRKGTGSDADGSDVAWSVSELISFLTPAITILPFIFLHHTAWLPVSLGINEQRPEKHPPVWGGSEYVCFFWTCLINCHILDLVEAVFSALALSQTAWHDWSTILARVKLTKMIEMDTVQNTSSCDRHIVEVWMLILALLTLRLIFSRFVEWIASLTAFI